MGTYGINTEEFIDGHLNITMNKNTNRYGFIDFLGDFEGDVSAETIAKAWNKISKQHKWGDKLKVENGI